MENKNQVKKDVKVEVKKEVGKDIKTGVKPVAPKEVKKIVVPLSRRGRIRELLKAGKSYDETYDTIIREFKGARAEIVKLQVKMNCKEFKVIVP